MLHTLCGLSKYQEVGELSKIIPLDRKKHEHFQALRPGMAVYVECFSVLGLGED
jgi:hypothetical protein